MADICVIHVSENSVQVEHLVAILRDGWTVWVADEMSHGDWEAAVRREIRAADAVVAVLSSAVQDTRTKILRDEMLYAESQGKPLLLFLLDSTEIPLGFGLLNRTSAYGWNGDPDNQGVQQLVGKLTLALSPASTSGDAPARSRHLIIGRKKLQLPASLFSLSSHETRVSPLDGAKLLTALTPEGALLSAYDLWNHANRKQERAVRRALSDLSATETVVVLDSGNYEASRKSDYASRNNRKKGWHVDHYRSVLRDTAPDMAFSFDNVSPSKDTERLAASIVRKYRADVRSVGDIAFSLCPIVHIPLIPKEPIASVAARIVSAVAAETDPQLIAIPERELGDGMRQRVHTVKAIREQLNRLGRYYPLHLLGTGNPLSMVAFAIAGADVFDGLEWCRTIVNYRTGNLFHFQHFDLFGPQSVDVVNDPKVRFIMTNPDASFLTRALSYNVDFFRDATRTMQRMIQTGNAESLLKMYPELTVLREDLRS